MTGNRPAPEHGAGQDSQQYNQPNFHAEQFPKPGTNGKFTIFRKVDGSYLPKYNHQVAQPPNTHQQPHRYVEETPQTTQHEVRQNNTQRETSSIISDERVDTQKLKQTAIQYQSYKQKQQDNSRIDNKKIKIQKQQPPHAAVSVLGSSNICVDNNQYDLNAHPEQYLQDSTQNRQNINTQVTYDIQPDWILLAIQNFRDTIQCPKCNYVGSLTMNGSIKGNRQLKCKNCKKITSGNEFEKNLMEDIGPIWKQLVLERDFSLNHKINNELVSSQSEDNIEHSKYELNNLKNSNSTEENLISEMETEMN